MNFQAVYLHVHTCIHVRVPASFHVRRERERETITRETICVRVRVHVSRFLTSAAYLLKKTETGNVDVKRVKMDVKQAERRKRTKTRPCTRDILGTDGKRAGI